MPTDDPPAVDDLHERLAATDELPVERSAGRWIGEAVAIAADLAAADLADGVVLDRLRHVRDLLAEVDATGHPEADDRVDEAKTIAEALIARYEDAPVD